MMAKWNVVLTTGAVGVAYAYWLTVGANATIKNKDGERIFGEVAKCEKVEN